MVYGCVDVLQGAMRRTETVKNARERVRLSIRRRLSEFGMTGRAFGRAFSANDGKGHVDTWVSGLLNGQFGLSLDELDEAARILKTTPSELVRSEYDHAEYLTPSERRVVLAVRKLPPPIRDHFLLLAEYLIGVAPEEIDLLRDFRDLTDDERARVRHWIHVVRIAREPVPALAILPDAQGPTALPADGARHTAGQPRRRKR